MKSDYKGDAHRPASQVGWNIIPGISNNMHVLLRFFSPDFVRGIYKSVHSCSFSKKTTEIAWRSFTSIHIPCTTNSMPHRRTPPGSGFWGPGPTRAVAPGTYKLSKSEVIKPLVNALKMGYRLIDTAQARWTRSAFLVGRVVKAKLGGEVHGGRKEAGQ